MEHHISVYIFMYIFLGAMAVIISIGLWHGACELKRELYDNNMPIPVRYAVMWCAFAIITMIIDIFTKATLSTHMYGMLVMSTVWYARSYKAPERPRHMRRGQRASTGTGGQR